MFKKSCFLDSCSRMLSTSAATRMAGRELPCLLIKNAPRTLTTSSWALSWEGKSILLINLLVLVDTSAANASKASELVCVSAARRRRRMPSFTRTPSTSMASLPHWRKKRQWRSQVCLLHRFFPSVLSCSSCSFCKISL